MLRCVYDCWIQDCVCAWYESLRSCNTDVIDRNYSVHFRKHKIIIEKTEIYNTILIFIVSHIVYIHGLINLYCVTNIFCCEHSGNFNLEFCFDIPLKYLSTINKNNYNNKDNIPFIIIVLKKNMPKRYGSMILFIYLFIILVNI